ncbi:MAG: methyl-accepting chemotaxis protein [Pseudomonadota bacterium]
MGLLTAIAIANGLFVFQQVSGQVNAVNDDRLPETQSATALIVTTTGFAERLNRIFTAQDTTSLGQLSNDVSSLSSEARAILQAMTETTAAEIEPMVGSVEQSLLDLITAQRRAIERKARVQQQVEEIEAINLEVSNYLQGQVDDSYFELVIGGETASGEIDEVLTNLVERDFQTLKLAIQIRAEANLLAGLIIALKQTRDPAFRSIFEDLATGAYSRLDETIEGLAEFDLDADVQTSISEARAFFESELSRASRSFSSDITSVLSARKELDGVLANLLDDMEFNLTIEAETAKETNTATIQGLLDNQVGRIQAVSALGLAVKSFVASALEGAFAQDVPATIIEQEKLTATRAVLENQILADLTEVQPLLDKMIAFSDPATGIISTRREVLSATGEATELAQVAVDQVKQITSRAGEIGSAALDRIGQSGEELSTAADDAWTAMIAVAAFAFLVILATRFMIARSITRPLMTLCTTTERLSEGEMSPLSGLPSDGRGEIGRMAAALEVFRNNALKMDEMREENARKDAESKAREREMLAMLSREIGTVVENGSRGDFSKRVEHHFDDTELAQLAEGINRLVSTVHEGLEETQAALTAIAKADLTHRMPTHFNGAFAELSTQANTTSDQLSNIISKVRDAAHVSSDRSREVDQGARILSRNAESQAASVQETTANMESMTESIKSSAETLIEAERLSTMVAEKTTQGSVTASLAVESVQNIAESSEKITKINTVIESISFQTNLLALNAAVEAARAGDAGKGFAVVASEVRTLAQRSAEAASEIDTLIKQSVALVKEGVVNVESTRTILEDIEQATKPVLSALADVAENGRQQSQRIQEVTEVVREIDAVTQKNANQAEQASNHATDLLSEVNGLEQLVSAFQTMPKPKDDAGVVAA